MNDISTRHLKAFIVLWLLAFFAGPARGDIMDDYRFTVFPYYMFSGGALGYNENIFRLNLKISLSRKGNARDAAAIQ